MTSVLVKFVNGMYRMLWRDSVLGGLNFHPGMCLKLPFHPLNKVLEPLDYQLLPSIRARMQIMTLDGSGVLLQRARVVVPPTYSQGMLLEDLGHFTTPFSLRRILVARVKQKLNGYSRRKRRKRHCRHWQSEIRRA